MKIIAVAILAFVGLFLVAWGVTHRFAHPPLPKSSIFHKPLKANCPQGTTLRAGFFSERDGTKEDACQNLEGDGSIDFLKGGETFSVTIPVWFAPEPKGPKT